MEEAAMFTVKSEESSLDSIKELEEGHNLFQGDCESDSMELGPCDEVNGYQWNSTYDSENHMEPFVSIIELEGGVIHPLEIEREKVVKRSPRKNPKGKANSEVVAGCSQASEIVTRTGATAVEKKPRKKRKPKEAKPGESLPKIIRINILTCTFCFYKTDKSSNLKLHLRKHTGERPFRCEECEYTTGDKSHLKIHMRTHSGERPYKCDKCPYESADSSRLLIHSRRHTGVKPFKCTYCPYETGECSSLTRHVRRHTGEKPYKCEHCPYATAVSSSLAVHMRKHLGIKPFECDKCPYATANSSNLTRHMGKHAGKVKVVFGKKKADSKNSKKKVNARKKIGEIVKDMPDNDVESPEPEYTVESLENNDTLDNSVESPVTSPISTENYIYSTENKINIPDKEVDITENSDNACQISIDC